MTAEQKASKRACDARYYQAHHEEIKANVAIWKQKNLDHVKAYLLEHREEKRVYMVEWHQAHPDSEAAVRTKAWKLANPLKVRAQCAKRHALKKGVTPGIVDYAAIMVRDKMRCGLCGKKVKAKDLHIDHIIPVSKSGPHAEYNLQVAHKACNLRKGATGKLPSQARLAIQV